MRPLFLVIAASVLASATVSSPSDAGEPIRCTCYFEQSSGYTAVGTRAACSTLTHKNMKGKGERCEISFGATGYEESVASKSNINPANLRDTAFKVTQQNLQSLFAQNPALVSDAGYLRDAIPAYMRATYLREEAQLDENVRVDLDKQVNAVADKYAEQIAGVFQGKRDPFEEKWQDRHVLAVERGAVRFVYSGEITLVLVAVFFDPRTMR